MAKSKAKKQREKWMREGHLNPEIKRSPFHALDLHTRVTKTKKDKLYQKKRKSLSRYDAEDGFFISPKTKLPFLLN
ncbi:hypothetical protein [Listeria costaricensis]|uniref:hypothetical protein n=1 Tax=Listeria costaricensis TaxID=2026604 RepID=UPI000C076570|nr:hypothetical protein [Listeria costaricensis]